MLERRGAVRRAAIRVIAMTGRSMDIGGLKIKRRFLMINDPCEREAAWTRPCAREPPALVRVLRSFFFLVLRTPLEDFGLLSRAVRRGVRRGVLLRSFLFIKTLTMEVRHRYLLGAARPMGPRNFKIEN